MDINKAGKLVLSEIEKKAVEVMFFGPYLDCWKDENGKVDNRDETIANRLGVRRHLVNLYLTKLTALRIKKPSVKADTRKYITVTIESKMNYE